MCGICICTSDFGCRNLKFVAVCRLRNPISDTGSGRMYWGCFFWFGVGLLIPLKSNSNSKLHLEILRKYTVPTIKKFLANKDWGRPIFVQDNARPHLDRVGLEYLKKHRIYVIDWPLQSLDLNLIENL